MNKNNFSKVGKKLNVLLDTVNFKKKCPHCTVSATFYPFENKDKKVCVNCGKYIFKDKQSEFKYRLEEEIFKEMREIR